MTEEEKRQTQGVTCPDSRSFCGRAGIRTHRGGKQGLLPASLQCLPSHGHKPTKQGSLTRGRTHTRYPCTPAAPGTGPGIQQVLNSHLQNEQSSPSRDRPQAASTYPSKQQGISESTLQQLVNCLTWNTLPKLSGLCVTMCKMG